ELTLVAELDRDIEQREGLRQGSVGQVRHRQALETRNRFRDDRKALPKLLEHVARERPVFRFPRQPKLGVARLDEYAPEGGHLRIERGRLGVRVSERALSSTASRPDGRRSKKHTYGDEHDCNDATTHDVQSPHLAAMLSKVGQGRRSAGIS